MTVLFNGNMESGPPWGQWGQPQSHNGSNPTDNASVHFGTWNIAQSPDPVGQGTYSCKVDVPMWNGGNNRSQAIVSRPNGAGTDDYYTYMVYIPSGWDTHLASGQWGVFICELNFQNATQNGSGPFALQLKNDHITVILESGLTTTTGNPYWYQYISNADLTFGGSINVPGMYAVPVGRLNTACWHNLIIHIKWAQDSTGQIEIWHQRKGVDAGWTKTCDFTGYPTVQMLSNGTVWPSTTLDTGMQMYCGAGNNVTNTLWFDNFTRSNTLADAQAQFPAPTIPANTVLPTISGTFQVGQTLTCNPGTWVPVPSSYSYQWKRANDGSGGGAATISGATAQTYALVSGDATKYIACDVTGNP